MELDTWIRGYKIRAFEWIDNKYIYFNVMYYRSGQSISSTPVWDKTVYIKNNKNGNKIVYEFTDSLVEYVSKLKVSKAILDFY